MSDNPNSAEKEVDAMTNKPVNWIRWCVVVGLTLLACSIVLGYIVHRSLGS
jgi:hypothetical protein